MINAIIIEDEPLAMERTQMYLQKLPFVRLLACFSKAQQALVFLQTHAVDLIFLDINLGEVSGIQLLETQLVKAEVIITTAYQEHALKGYELNVTDYLLKPYGFDRFCQAVEKARARLEKSESTHKSIFIKTENRMEKILLSEILYIAGMRDYRRIFTQHKKIMTLQNFKDLEQEIPSDLICRVHKSYMVSLSKIDAVERHQVRIGETLIPISETYRKDFFAKIDQAFKKKI